jgi:hypothetical protein
MFQRRGRANEAEGVSSTRRDAFPFQYRVEIIMRIVAITLLVLVGFCDANDAAQAQQSSCKVCGEQQRACMKNYAGPTCKSEYQMCMKSCRAK